MTKRIEDFISLKAHEEVSVSFGVGKKGYILSIKSIDKNLNYAIKYVYYLDSLKYNLLSVS